MLDKSLLYLSNNHNYINETNIFYFRATAYKELKRYQEAIESTLKAVEISKKYKYAENYDRENELLINLYFLTKNLAKAKELLAVREANVNEDSINLKRFSYHTRANIALVENDIDKWNYYSEKYDSVENLFTSNTIKKNIVEFETKYNVAKREVEIARQETESKNRFWIIVALTLGLVSITIAAFAQYVIYKNKQKLALQQQQLALAEERIRIAADMHDDMGAGISRIRFLGEGIKHFLQSEKAKEDVNTMIGLSDDLVDKMNEIIWTLNTGDELLQEIFYYMRSQCSQLVSDAGIAFESNIPDNLPTIIYTAAQKCNLFLAIKEAVHNALKHAQATQITLNVEADKNISITIADNGKGFDIATAKGNGSGLYNYEKRMKALGGDFAIDSCNAGTTVKFILS